MTVADYRRFCTNLLLDFAEQGITQWTEISTRSLTSAFLRSTNKDHFVAKARRFFKYLTEVEVVNADYSCVLIRPAKRKPVPSVYSEAEIQKLLDCVETITPQGKRDHAILLLAVRLGLRASDIRNLRFENVDFEKARVQFVQFKTSVPHKISLPTLMSAENHCKTSLISTNRNQFHWLCRFCIGKNTPTIIRGIFFEFLGFTTPTGS